MESLVEACHPLINSANDAVANPEKSQATTTPVLTTDYTVAAGAATHPLATLALVYTLCLSHGLNLTKKIKATEIPSGIDR